jgi:hypothetical protein
LQKKIYIESKNAPLTNKNYGIEFNLFRLLLIDKSSTLSGSFSLFNVNRNAEISFPFYYQDGKNSDVSEFSLDCHYRYFLGNTQNGFYLSGFARYAFLNGPLKNDYTLYYQSNNKNGSVNKLGIGVGLGYRIFSYKGLYWGASVSFGRFLTDNNNKFSGSSSILSIGDDTEYIFDIEFLKFGWAF